MKKKKKTFCIFVTPHRLTFYFKTTKIKIYPREIYIETNHGLLSMKSGDEITNQNSRTRKTCK